MHAALKRIFDLAVSLGGLIVLSPLFGIIALLVKCSDGGPVLYRQERVGQFGRLFRILKFRTMVVDADKRGAGVTKRGDERITRVGRLLRKAKLDELPQLWNVLTGKMSFVGPRPEVPKYVEKYTPEQRKVLNLKPGITDLATLLFRNEEELLRNAKDVEKFYVEYCLPPKIDFNLKYSKNASLFTDIWLIFQTVCPYWIGILMVYGMILSLSFVFAYLLRFDFEVPYREREHILRFMLWIMPMKLLLLTWRKQVHGLLSYFNLPEIRQISFALAVATLIQFGVWYATGGAWAPSRAVILIDYFVSCTFLCAVRVFLRLLREHYYSTNPLLDDRPRRLAIIGAGDLGAALACEFFSKGNLRHRVVAFFDDDPKKWHKLLHDIPVVGMPEMLFDEPWREGLDEVLIAMPNASRARVKEISKILKRLNIKFHTVGSQFEFTLARVLGESGAAEAA